MQGAGSVLILRQGRCDPNLRKGRDLASAPRVGLQAADARLKEHLRCTLLVCCGQDQCQPFPQRSILRDFCAWRRFARIRSRFAGRRARPGVEVRFGLASNGS